MRSKEMKRNRTSVIESNQIRSTQIRSNPVKSDQIKSNQIQIQIEYNDMMSDRKGMKEWKDMKME
jgi:hypothetical protein